MRKQTLEEMRRRVRIRANPLATGAESKWSLSLSGLPDEEGELPRVKWRLVLPSGQVLTSNKANLVVQFGPGRFYVEANVGGEFTVSRHFQFENKPQ